MNAHEDIAEEHGALLPDPKAIVPNALQKVNAVFIGPVINGYFQPAPDNLQIPPRWEQGSYSLTAGKWPSEGIIPDMIDLTPYNGYSILVMASVWDKEVISQARIFGVLTNMANDVITKFAYDKLQEKEEEVASYISGINN